MEERFDVDVLGKEKPTHVQTCKKSFPSPFVVDCENQRGSMRDSVKEVVESMAKDKEDGILDWALVAENVHLLLNQKGGESANFNCIADLPSLLYWGMPHLILRVHDKAVNPRLATFHLLITQPAGSQSLQLPLLQLLLSWWAS